MKKTLAIIALLTLSACGTHDQKTGQAAAGIMLGAMAVLAGGL